MGVWEGKDWVKKKRNNTKKINKEIKRAMKTGHHLDLLLELETDLLYLLSGEGEQEYLK